MLFEEQVRTGQFVNNNIKFETLAKKWLQQVELEGNLKSLTINKYKQMQERTYKAIGHLKITEINRIHIQRFINSLTKDSVNQLTKGGLSTICQFCKKDFPVVTVQGLRHTKASLLISSGADVKTVSSTLGRNQTSTTLDIYAHSFALKQAEASQAVAELLTPRKRA